MVLRVAVSFVLVADVVAVAFAIVGMDTIKFAPISLVITFAIILFFAAPVYFVLRIKWRETWRSCLVAGFIVGSVTAAVVLLPASGSVQIGREMTVVAGVRTAAGWRMYAEAVGIAGGIGAGAGAVFWASLRLQERAARWPGLGPLPLTAGISLAIGASWTIFAIPSLTMDRSCHNVSRDGRDSISAVLTFTVELAAGEWPRFQDTAERFASHERWNLDESNDKDKELSPSRFVSACVEPGTEIRFEGADKPGVRFATVSVYQPQGGNDWQEPVRRLLESIEASFPGKLRRNLSDAEVQSPSTLLPQQ